MSRSRNTKAGAPYDPEPPHEGTAVISETKRQPWAMVYRDEMMSPEMAELPPASRWVWLGLRTFLAPGNTWSVSIGTLAEVCGYNRRTIERSIEDLVTAKMLKKSYRNKDGRQLPNAWTLIDPPSIREKLSTDS